MKMKLLILLLLFAGCSATNNLTVSTPSGKPEIYIPKVAKKPVSDEFVNQMLTQGYNVKSTSDYNIVFIKPVDNFGVNLLLGSQYDATTEYRVTSNLVESSSGTRLVLTIQIITNPGSAFERVTDISKGKPGNSWQEFLTSFAGLFKGRIGIDCDAEGTITNISNNSPGQQSGLMLGDKIISIDGNPFKDYKQVQSLVIGEPDTNVELVILRGEKSLTFIVNRKLLYPTK